MHSTSIVQINIPLDLRILVLVLAVIFFNNALSLCKMEYQAPSKITKKFARKMSDLDVDVD